MAREIVKAVMLGGKEFAFNLYNAKTAAAYEQGMTVLQADEAEYESLGEMITARVGAVRRFLDMLFGDGAAEEVLGEIDYLNVALDCVEAVVRTAAEQGEAMAERAEAYKKGIKQ